MKRRSRCQGNRKGVRILITKTVGKVVKVVGFVTFAYNAANGGVSYAIEQTGRDLVFADEIEAVVRPAAQAYANAIEKVLVGEGGLGYELNKRRLDDAYEKAGIDRYGNPLKKKSCPTN